MKKRIFALIFALFMLLSVLSSCVENELPEGTDPDNGSAQTSGTENKPQYPVPEEVDLGGFVYRALVLDNKLWEPVYFAEGDQENGTYINDALYRREAYLEEKYHCTFEYIVDKNAAQTLGNHVSTSTDLCETVYLTGKESMQAATSGYLLDINDIEGLNLDCPWWDQRIQEEYLIGDHLFTLEGDMNMIDELRTTGIVYNKRIYADKNFNTLYGSPYQLVANKEWTLEKLIEMITDVTEDPENDEGVWGMLSEVAGPYYFFLGLGEKTVTNKAGQFTLNVGSENVSNALQYTMQLAKHRDVMIVNNGNHFGNNDVWGNATKLFSSGNVLFRSTTLSAVNGLIDMTDDYGLLPIPNRGGTDEYYCYVSGSNHRPLTFPANLKNEDKVILLTEAMTYYSRFSPNSQPSLRESFYDLLAEYRLARDIEDTQMLDIIFDSKTFDIDQAADLTGLESRIWSLSKAGNLDGVTSAITMTKKVADKSVQRFIDALAEKYE